MKGQQQVCLPAGASLWLLCVPAWGPSAGLQALASWQRLSCKYISPSAEGALTMRTGRWPQSGRGDGCCPGPENTGQAREPDEGSVPPPRPPGLGVPQAGSRMRSSWAPRTGIKGRVWGRWVVEGVPRAAGPGGGCRKVG